MTTNQEEDNTTLKTTTSWGTWEELLLACAVKRHGLKNWESVAMELQTKTSLPRLLTTAQFCKQKYVDLKRRFKDHHHDSNNNNIPWLEHLRKVRVDELKQDLQRYDLSIHCLQLKVKRLEEEREREPDNNNTNMDPEPDLNQPNTSQDDNNKGPAKSDEPDKEATPRLEDSDRDNRSVNESNSTGLSDKVGGGGGGGELVKSEAEPVGSGLGREGEGGGGTTKAEESEELGDSVTQLSSDVQSSASYGRKKRKIGTGGDAKSEPLIRLLDVIRTHKHASLFERRLKLELQESSNYKDIVRQHVDLETIETRVERGLYSSCHLNFYRDLLLLFNNAIVFFPKSSLESSTAHELGRLVSIEINKEARDSSQEPRPEPQLQTSDSLLDRQKSTAPIIVCRKRSSVSAKPSSTFAQKPDHQQPSDDKDKDKEKKKEAASSSTPCMERSSLLKLKTQEKAIRTGTRSSRRNTNSKNPTSTSSSSPPPPSNYNKKESTGSKEQEVSKTDNKKKTEAASASASASDKKKSVVDFLKRIKKNSPVQSEKKKKKKKKNSKAEVPKRSSNNKDKKGKERQSSGEKKESTSSPSKKHAAGRRPKTTPTPVTGKRAREVVVVAKRQSKRARSRR